MRVWAFIYLFGCLYPYDSAIPGRRHSRNPFNPQLLISHLTNSNGCGNLQVKVLLTVSPVSSFLSPTIRCVSERAACLFQDYVRLCVSVPLWQIPSFQQLAASLSLPKKSTPLQSSKSRLFCQNTRGGVPSAISVLRSQCPRFSPCPLCLCGKIPSRRNPAQDKTGGRRTAEVRTSSR